MLLASQVGDTISFTYSSSYHDVVRVGDGNTDCDLSAATIVDETGSYQYVVQASDTQVVFACGRGNHCASGQQVTVNVASGGGGSCAEDIDGSGNVEVNDLLSMLSAFGGAGAAGEDVSGDGIVDVNDLLQLLGAFGSTCAAAPAPAPAAAAPCALGEDCGGQVFNGCGTMCPATCGVPMGMCNMMCNSGFQCANAQFWDPLDGVAGACVDQGACSVATNDLPPGMAAGRPFLSAKTAPMFAHAVEVALSDWVGV